MKTNQEFLKSNGLLLLLLFGVFIFVFVFFTRTHPLYMFDIDDWYHTYMTRPLYPIWHGFNPAKVLPEILMPMMFDVAMSVVYPFLNDITISMCIVSATLLALLITVYVYCFYRILRNKVVLAKTEAVSIALIFFLLHFLFYRASNILPNKHAFYSYDVACIYHYIIPSLLNAILVMYFIGGKPLYSLLKDSNYIKSGIILLLVYLAIFSNLYSNIILSLYIFIDLLLHIKKKEIRLNLTKYGIYKYSIHFSVLLIWLISIVFEANGGRGAEANSIFSTWSVTLFHFVNLFSHGMNRFNILVSCSIVFVGFVYVLKQKKYLNDYMLNVTYILLILLYYVLLSSKVDPRYMERADAMYGFTFYTILFVSLSLAFILKKNSFVGILIPIFALCIICQTNIKNKTFQGIPYDMPEKMLEINNRLIGEIIQADRENLDSLTIKVPYYPTQGNWPLGKDLGNRIRANLQKHGFIDNTHDIEVKVIIDNRVQK